MPRSIRIILDAIQDVRRHELQPQSDDEFDDEYPNQRVCLPPHLESICMQLYTPAPPSPDSSSTDTADSLEDRLSDLSANKQESAGETGTVLHRSILLDSYSSGTHSSLSTAISTSAQNITNRRRVTRRESQPEVRVRTFYFHADAQCTNIPYYTHNRFF